MNYLPCSAVAMFAEDLRDEQAGTHSLIGIMPDNIEVQSMPGMMTKLAVYTRINFSPDTMPDRLEVLLRVTGDGSILNLSIIPREILQQSVADTMAKNGPLVTIINRTVAAALVIPHPDRLESVVKWNDEEIIAGSLNITLPDGVNPGDTTPAV